MTTPTEQPEALILADKLEREARISPRIFVADERKEAAAELRRLHKENEALRADRDSWIEQASDRVKDCCDILAAREADREAMRMALNAMKTELSYGPLIKECHDAIEALKARGV